MFGPSTLWAWLIFCLTIGISFFTKMIPSLISYEDCRGTLAGRMKHPCRRVCKHAAPMVCEYNFEIGQWNTMTGDCQNCPKNSKDCFAPSCVPADGLQKEIIAVNKQLPGPLIEVCKGDRIIVKATNNLPHESTTLHWHAIEQRGTPFMDGVPYITQCPMFPGQSYIYNYTVPYGGTYFWHSHSYEQRGDGDFGGLIVREPSKCCKYDYDKHVMILNEWSPVTSKELNKMDELGLRGPTPYNILINGLGRYPPNSTNNIISTFDVEEGRAYRFRVIDAGSQLCIMSLTIEDHDLTVISTDALDIVPVKVDAIRILAGERYDFILKADKKPRNYWIQVRAVDGTTGCKMNKVFQMAILRYKGAPKIDPPRKPSYGMFKERHVKQLNPYNKGLEHPLCIARQDTVWPDGPANTRQPDHQFFLIYGKGLDAQKSNNTVKQGLQYVEPNNNNTKTFWRFDSINFKYPSVPLLTQYHQVDSICDHEGIDVNQCDNKFCQCTHVLQVELKSVVEVVLIDRGYITVNHPIHLHGFWFRVVGMGTFKGPASIELFKEMDEEGQIQRKLKHAVLKDTIMVPYNGYTVIRFYADNPGVWLMHCHFESHARNGLDVVFKVGEVDEFPPVPPSIPRC